MSKQPFAELGGDGGFDPFGAPPAGPEPAARNATTQKSAARRQAAAKPAARADDWGAASAQTITHGFDTAPGVAADGFTDWEIDPGLVLTRSPEQSPEPTAPPPGPDVAAAGDSADSSEWTVVETDAGAPSSPQAAERRPPGPGDCVGSNYLLLRRCSQGVDHESFQALDLERRAEVLVRIHAPGPRPQLLHEAQCLSRMRHPVMPQVLDLGITDGAAFVVFAPEIGLSLPAFACASGGCAPAAVLRMAYQLTQAMQEAERHGVRFGRLLPEQVRIGPDGMPKILGLDTEMVTGSAIGGSSASLLSGLARAAFDLPAETGSSFDAAGCERPPVGFQGPLGMAQVLDAVRHAEAAESTADTLERLAAAARRFGLDAEPWHVDLDVDPLGPL